MKKGFRKIEQSKFFELLDKVRPLMLENMNQHLKEQNASEWDIHDITHYTIKRHERAGYIIYWNDRKFMCYDEENNKLVDLNERGLV